MRMAVGLWLGVLGYGMIWAGAGYFLGHGLPLMSTFTTKAPLGSGDYGIGSDALNAAAAAKGAPQSVPTPQGQPSSVTTTQL